MCCPKDDLGVQRGVFGGVLDPFLTETYPVRPPDAHYTQIMLTFARWNKIFEGDYDNVFQSFRRRRPDTLKQEVTGSCP